MTPKKNRADKKDVISLFKNGRYINSINLSLKFNHKKDPSPPRISFIVPKKITKSAVERNSIRRLGYNIIYPLLPGIKLGIVGVFIFKKFPKDIFVLKNEIKTMVNKIN